ncbi:hypothetical protein ACIRPT_29355 [Streptomyces sp. NPDC101227]|uniref:hypothetical protein n=1 Tax=Streptomyces sp. NPDC101227 TaxID=3366136 RepID=UPI0037F54499
MGGKGEYGVDLDALEEVVRELHKVLAFMGDAQSTSEHSTYLPQGSLGSNFSEVSELYSAHKVVKGNITRVMKRVDALVDAFGKKSAKVRDAYQDAEAENSIKM